MPITQRYLVKKINFEDLKFSFCEMFTARQFHLFVKYYCPFRGIFITVNEQYTSWSFSLCNYSSPSLYILLAKYKCTPKNPVLKVLNLLSLHVTDQVLHPT